MLTREENNRLTLVGPGTPAGELMRRYWHPVCALSELEALGIKRVRILGEDVVVFILPDGDIGLVKEACSHRGASLAYGFIEEDGLRCAYHGWKYGTDGKCLEQPFEPEVSKYKERIQQRSYPVKKLAGLVWTYMGPEPIPFIPAWDVLIRRDGARTIRSVLYSCNWLQVVENDLDSTHVYFLHGVMSRRSELARKQTGGFDRQVAKYDWEQYEYGILKRRTYKGQIPTEEVVDDHPFIFPLWVYRGDVLLIRTPLDDTHTLFITLRFHKSPNGELDPQPENKVPVEYYGIPLTRSGLYNLDYLMGQDGMATETEGPVFDRSAEHLGASDRGVTMYRNLLAKQIEIVQNGGNPVNFVLEAEKNGPFTFPVEVGPGLGRELSIDEFKRLCEGLMPDDGGAGQGGPPITSESPLPRSRRLT